MPACFLYVWGKLGSLTSLVGGLLRGRSPRGKVNDKGYKYSGVALRFPPHSMALGLAEEHHAEAVQMAYC